MTVSGSDNTGIARTWVTVGPRTRFTAMAVPVHEPTALRRPHRIPSRSHTTTWPQRAYQRCASGRRTPRGTCAHGRLRRPRRQRTAGQGAAGRCGRGRLATLERVHRQLAEPGPGLRPDHSRLVPAVRPTGLRRRLRSTAATDTADRASTVGGSGEHTLRGLARGRGGQPVLRPERVRPGLTCGSTRRLPRWRSSRRSEADPLRVAVRVADRHSGVDTGEIEMRQRGGNVWHSLADRPRGPALVATWTTSASAPAPTSSARALGTAPATRARPTGGPRAREPRSSFPPASPPRLTVGRRRVTRAQEAAHRSCSRRSATARHDSRLTLHGRLTNSDGQPLGRRHGPGVVRLPRRRRRPAFPSGSPAPIATGGSRTSSVRRAIGSFGSATPGSRRIRAATADFELRVPGGQLHPAPVRGGSATDESVRLSGAGAHPASAPRRES